MKFFLAAVIGLAATFAAPANAQNYPNQIIKVIVPFPPGGVLDAITRSITERLREKLGQAAIIENRAGAFGSLGLETCAKAPPDGYTICAATIEQMITAPYLEPEQWARYKTLAPLTQMVRAGGVIYASPDLGIKTLDDLVALAKKEPGKLNYASFGRGSSPQLVFEWLRANKGADLFHVPMRSAGDVMNELVGGRIQASYVTVGFAKPQAEAGKIVPLAVTGDSREPLLPEVPSLGELGLDFPYKGGWFALMAPPGVDEKIMNRLAGAVRELVEEPDYRNKFLTPQGYVGIGNTPAEFAAALKAEATRGEQLAKLVPPTNN